MVDIWRFTKTGNVLGVVEKFTRWVGQNAKLAIYTEVMHYIFTVHCIVIVMSTLMKHDCLTIVILQCITTTGTCGMPPDFPPSFLPSAWVYCYVADALTLPGSAIAN